MSGSLPVDHDSCWHVQWGHLFFLNSEVQINSTVIKMALNQQQMVTRRNACAGARCRTWVRMRTAAPSPRTGDCMSSRLELFQAPVERRVIRDEDQLCSPATNNASPKDKRRAHDAATRQHRQKKGRGSKKLQIPYRILSLLTRKASVSKNCSEQVQSSVFSSSTCQPGFSPSPAGLPPKIQQHEDTI